MSESSQSRQSPIVWCIGGVDPTALAGISADNRAVAVSGAHGVNLVTCLTAQNSNAFFAKQATSVEFLEQQWLALAQQCLPCVIKIGLLVNVEQVTWLSEKLANFQERCGVKEARPWIIYDPVLRASSDAAPMLSAMIKAINTQLMPHIDLLTPNLHEAMALSSAALEKVTSSSALADYAKSLSKLFNTQVLLKGGHVSDVCLGEKNLTFTDFYARDSAITSLRYLPEPCHTFLMTQPCTQQSNRRGSGCIMASLIAGFVANQYTFCDAIIYSAGVMLNAYRYAAPLGTGAGGALTLTPNVHCNDLPQINFLNDAPCSDNDDEPFASCPESLGLYPVIDCVQWLERLLNEGVTTIQLRAKDRQDDEVEPLIIEAIALGRKYNARVFINDYWQLAIKHGAYGVHLGQKDMAVADLARIKLAGLRLGLSTHGLFEAQWASQFKPSYMAIGHIFATQTKDMPSRPQGIDKLNTQVQLFSNKLPLVAIGGISAPRIQSVLDSHVKSVAVVTAITQAQNPERTTRQLLLQVGAGDAHEPLERA